MLLFFILQQRTTLDRGRRGTVKFSFTSNRICQRTWLYVQKMQRGIAPGTPLSIIKLETTRIVMGSVVPSISNRLPIVRKTHSEGHVENLLSAREVRWEVLQIMLKCGQHWAESEFSFCLDH